MNSALAVNLDRAGSRVTLQRHSYQQPVCDLSKHLHVVPSGEPSPRPQHGAEQAPMEWPTVARKGEPDRDEIRSGLHQALNTAVPQYRNPAKEVAARVKTSEATVRGLRQQNIPEAMITLIMLGRAYPEFAAEVRKLMALESDLDPIAERVFSDLRQLVANRSGR
jgi:hypothetical protein